MPPTHPRALTIYARPPELGRVKTRLQPDLTPRQSLELYEAMLADVLERTLRAAEGSCDVFVSFSGACAAGGELGALLASARVEYQMGDDLGQRMSHTIQTRLREGYARVVLIGSDSPNLPLDYLDQAFEALAAVDVVIGPADDGGYYLIGARRLHPRLFQRMPWGTERVMVETRERMASGRVTCHELPRWYDVDTPAAVARLWSDLRAAREAGDEDLPQRTCRQLATMMSS